MRVYSLAGDCDNVLSFEIVYEIQVLQGGDHILFLDARKLRDLIDSNRRHLSIVLHGEAYKDL